mmetsp:Transcript_32519/g.97882  ORF Transcript_32519/g.97882 Transcript_32519/m.97882 type:complete len:212 (+) Transcript_32519:441-1076(+)
MRTPARRPSTAASSAWRDRCGGRAIVRDQCNASSGTCPPRRSRRSRPSFGTWPRPRRSRCRATTAASRFCRPPTRVEINHCVAVLAGPSRIVRGARRRDDAVSDYPRRSRGGETTSSRTQAAIVVTSDRDSAIKWGLGYRDASRFDDRRPIVLAWCGEGPTIPNKRQCMVSFAAVERFDPASGEGARTILEAVATALMRAEKPRERRCVLS